MQQRSTNEQIEALDTLSMFLITEIKPYELISTFFNQDKQILTVYSFNSDYDVEFYPNNIGEVSYIINNRTRNETLYESKLFSRATLAYQHFKENKRDNY